MMAFESSPQFRVEQGADRLDEITILIIVLLFGLGGVLALVTLIGHGIWMMLAALFGRRSRSNSQPVVWDGRSALDALRRQLEEFAERGAIDAPTRAQLTAAIDAQERQLVERQKVAASIEDIPLAAASIENTPLAAAEPAAGSAAARGAPSTPDGPAAEAAAPAPSVPLVERARKYAASREAAVAESTAGDLEDVELVELPKRREALARLFAAFMEEKNIRWGELVGGLLIVGCSIALVISFWSEIAARPLVKYLLFNGVTAALFGVGLYTERRWKIHTTSHALLVIATLLVPLNFLAMAAFTQNSPPTDLASLAGEATSLAVFAWLVYLAGRILVPGRASLLVVGVMVPCLMQLVVRRFAEPATPLAWLYALAAVPVGVYFAGSLLVVRRQWLAVGNAADPEATLDGSAANRVLVFLGLVSAATLVPLALLVYNVPPPRETLHWLSPLAAVCGLPAVLVGLLFWRRVTDRRLTGLQTAGVGVGALGALAMGGAVALAWPDPATLLPTALATAAVMLVVAWWFAIPAAHVPAGLALAAAWLVTFYLVRGEVGWTLADDAAMRSSLLSATSGHALVPLVALFGIVAWRLRSAQRGESARMYALVTAATAAVSLGFVFWFGFARPGDPQHATWTIAIYAAAALAAAALLDRADVTRIGAGLLLAALVQGIVFRYGDLWRLEQPWIVALLAHATLAAVGGGLLRWPRLPARENAQSALVWSAFVTSAAAAVWIAVTLAASSAAAVGINLAWLAGVWMLLSMLGGWPALFTASQAALMLAIFCGVTAAVEGRAWYVDSDNPWLDPWFLEAQAIALAGYCLAVGTFREVVTQSVRRQSQYVIEPPTPAWRAASERLLNPPWPALDHVVQCAIVVVLALVATYGAAPGVAQELSPTDAATGAARVVPPVERFELAGIPHAHAASEGAWMLLAAVVLTLASGLRQGDTRWRLAGLTLAAFAACPLLAARWEEHVAVASALRWLSAGAFALLAIPVWRRPRREVRDLMVALVLLVYVAMGAYVCQAVLLQSNVGADIRQLWPWLCVWALLAGVVGFAVPHTAGPRRDDVDGLLTGQPSAWALHARHVAWLLAVAPLAILLTFAVAKGLDARPLVGPDPGTWFRRIGWDVSYGVPLVVIALVFIGYAVRDRSGGFAFAAGLLFNVVATIVVLLRLARGAGALDAVAWVTVAQVNAIVAGIGAIVWLAAVAGYWRMAGGAKPQAAGEVVWPRLLVTQVALAAALCGVFLIPAIVDLGWTATPANWVVAADGVAGWLAVALAAAAAVWLHGRQGLVQEAVAMFAAALAALAALTAAHWDTGNWLAFDALTIGFCAGAWLVPLATRAFHQPADDPQIAAAPIRWSAPAVRMLAVVAVLLALRGLGGRGFTPWWSYAALVAISARNLWIAWHERRRGFVWIAALLFGVAVNGWWAYEGYKLTSATGFGQIAEWLWLNVLAAAAMAWISVWIERRRIAPATALTGPPRTASFHRFAAWAVVVVLLLTTGFGLMADLASNSLDASTWLGWSAWTAALVTAAACLWDPGVRWSVACLYCVGLVAVGLYLDGLDLRAPMFHWALANALAAYSLATSTLWSGRGRLREVASRLGVPAATWGSFSETADSEFRRNSATWEGDGQGWLVSANLLIGVAVLLLVGWIELVEPSFTRRMVAAYAVGAQALAIGLLARGAVRTPLQYLALAWGVLFAVAFSWAWLPPDFAEPWLHRLVVTVVALAAAVVVYGFGLVKLLRRENEWTRAAGRLVPTLTALAAVLILFVLGLEVAAYAQDGSVPIAWPAVVAVGLALAILTVSALAAALLAGHDPLGLSERGRTAYVYAAEALVALSFLHIRVTMPWLFRGWFQQFWPLVVMGIAFVGVGFGELFQRRRQRVLSEPLQTTGALLPLLPAVGFWVQSSILASKVDYSLTLLSVGVLYAALSVLRQSFLYGVLAAVAANGSLWYLLSRREGLSLLEHPQLWLIPPALCALAAGYINRRRLTDQQSASLRYASAIVIYVSSTADVFINGVAEAPWLPAVLAGLSILGVLAGIMLRVRAFLYLGTAFLVVALMTIIWHAAIHQQRTYILWVAGIVTGALIIALFALFEKRRDDVLRVVEELKHWQA